MCRIVTTADELRLRLFLVILEQLGATYERGFECVEIFTRKFGEFDVLALLERRPVRGSGLIIPIPITVGGVGVVVLVVVSLMQSDW